MNASSVKYEGFSSDADKRTTNFARAFEHDFIGHNVNGISSDGDDQPQAPGGAESLVNQFRTEIGLGNLRALNYSAIGPDGTYRRYFGNGDDMTAQTTAVLTIKF